MESTLLKRVQIVAVDFIEQGTADIMGVPGGRAELLYLEMEVVREGSACGLMSCDITFKAGIRNPFGEHHHRVKGAVSLLCSYSTDGASGWFVNNAEMSTEVGHSFSWENSHDHGRQIKKSVGMKFHQSMPDAK